MKNNAVFKSVVILGCIFSLGCSTKLPDTGLDYREDKLEIFQECVLPPMEKLIEEKGTYSYDDAPELIKYENPRYPKYYRDNDVEGTVLLRVEIDHNI